MPAKKTPNGWSFQENDRPIQSLWVDEHCSIDREYAGQTLNWYGSDNAADYKSAYNVYSRDDITYQFNSHGFRCDEFEGEYDLKVLFVGCSKSLGTGVRLEECYAHRLVTRLREHGLRVPYWNVSAGGKSMSYCTRILYRTLPMLTPDLVFAYFPDPHRRELFLTDPAGGYQFIDYTQAKLARFAGINAKVIPQVFNDMTDDYDAAHNLAFFKTMMSNYGCEYLWNIWYMKPPDPALYTNVADAELLANWFPHIMWSSKPVARDGSHPGRMAHATFADSVWLDFVSRVNRVLAKKGHTLLTV